MTATKNCERCSRPYTPLRRGFCKNCDARRRSLYGYRCSFVDAEPVRLHVKNLIAAGVGTNRIAKLSSLKRNTVRFLMYGRPDRGSGPSKRVSTKTANAILAIPIPQSAHHLAADHCPVDSTGTRRRLQSLVAFGYTRRYLAERIGMTPTSLSRLINSDLAVRAVNARQIEKLYTELEAIPGPSTQARKDGIRNGWPVPALWDDDIDLPEAAPVEDSSVEVTYCELYEEMRSLGYSPREVIRRYPVQYRDRAQVIALLTDEGMSAKSIADLLDLSERTVVRYRTSNKMPVQAYWIAEQAG